MPENGSHRVDYTGRTDGQPVYEGWAIRKGAATSAAVWKIKKYIYTSDSMTQEQWANGNELYDNIWDNITSLTYN